MRHLSIGQDRIYLTPNYLIDVDVNHIEKNYTQPGMPYVKHARKKIISEDVKKQDIDFMPGFRFTWYFSRIEEVPKVPQFADDDMTKIFVRKYSLI